MKARNSRGRARVLMAVFMALLALAAAQTANASSYNGQSPTQTGCTAGAQNVGGEDVIVDNDLSATIQILSSPSCPYAIWVAIHISSGANGQYRAKVELSGSEGVVVFEGVITQPLVQTAMLSDATSCVRVSISIMSLNGDSSSTVGDEVCEQGFAFTGVAPSPMPGQMVPPSSPSAAPSSGSPPTTNGPGSTPPSAHKFVRHKKCFGRHHRRVKCRKHAKYKRG